MTGQGDELPERLPVQAREGKGDAARPRHGDDAASVAGEELVQLDELARDADPARRDRPARAAEIGGGHGHVRRAGGYSDLRQRGLAPRG